MFISFWFTISEGLKGFKRARLAATITIFSTTIALLLVGLFLLFSVNVNQWLGEKQARIELEVYFDADLDGQRAQSLSREIAKIKGIAKAVFVSKESAARRFSKEFGQDIYEVLGSNPLPASCTIRLKKGFRGGMPLSRLMAEIRKLPGVNDIVYEQEVIALINRYIKIIYLIIGVIGLLLTLVSSLLLFNTTRLTVMARKDIIEIMKLVGATRSFIRRPFLIEGFIQGLIGALLASAFLYLLTFAVKKYFFSGLLIRNELYPAIFLLGALIGFISSKASLSKYLK